MASKSAAKEGLKLLRLAESRSESLRHYGKIFPVPEVENIEYPLPNLWSAESEEDSDAQRHVHNGDEFIVVRDGENIRHLRWSAISSYRLVTAS